MPQIRLSEAVDTYSMKLTKTGKRRVKPHKAWANDVVDYFEQALGYTPDNSRYIVERSANSPNGEVFIEMRNSSIFIDCISFPYSIISIEREDAKNVIIDTDAKLIIVNGILAIKL